MAAKWGHAGTLSVSSGSGIRDDKKTSRSFNLQQVNEISLLIQGQQTVQDIVGKATDLFRYLEGAKVVVDEKSKAETRNNNKKVQETLNGLKELFSRLRVIYDESNRRIDISQGENLESMVPLKLEVQESEMEAPKDATALQIEHDTLQEKLRNKNEEVKHLIDKLRTLMWDINVMMAVKPS
ncbi:mediator of RNA polymerase II transcription subunit 30-like [Montipora foliosa]|uniref:mediator of RNA polymerase II transcription subunit 30-like n=1 Tax=Montipora foliosa TaxID=591990 RepID=UPI0035F14EE8